MALTALLVVILIPHMVFVGRAPADRRANRERGNRDRTFRLLLRRLSSVFFYITRPFAIKQLSIPTHQHFLIFQLLKPHLY